jgi:hypothetical protein
LLDATFDTSAAPAARNTGCTVWGKCWHKRRAFSGAFVAVRTSHFCRNSPVARTASVMGRTPLHSRKTRAVTGSTWPICFAHGLALVDCMSWNPNGGTRRGVEWLACNVQLMNVAR